MPRGKKVTISFQKKKWKKKGKEIVQKPRVVEPSAMNSFVKVERDREWFEYGPNEIVESELMTEFELHHCMHPRQKVIAQLVDDGYQISWFACDDCGYVNTKRVKKA